MGAEFQVYFVYPLSVNAFSGVRTGQNLLCAECWWWKEMPQVRAELQIFADS